MGAEDGRGRGAENGWYGVPAMGMRERRGWGGSTGTEDEDLPGERVRGGTEENGLVGVARVSGPTSARMVRGRTRSAWTGPPASLDAQAGEGDDSRARVHGCHQIDRGVGMERTDGFAPGVPGRPKGGKLCVAPCGLVTSPPGFELLIPSLPVCCSADTNTRSPGGGVSIGVHRDLLRCVRAAIFYWVRFVIPTA
jgi:hypothetical protein